MARETSLSGILKEGKGRGSGRDRGMEGEKERGAEGRGGKRRGEERRGERKRKRKEKAGSLEGAQHLQPAALRASLFLLIVSCISLTCYNEEV